MTTVLKVGDRVKVVGGDADFGMHNGTEHTVIAVSLDYKTVRVFASRIDMWFNMSRFELIKDEPVVDKLQTKIDEKIEELREIKAAFRKAQRELSKLQEVQTIVNAL